MPLKFLRPKPLGHIKKQKLLCGLFVFSYFLNGPLQAMEFPNLFRRPPANNRPAIPFSQFYLDGDTWTERFGGSGERLPPVAPPQTGNGSGSCTSTDGGAIKLYALYKPVTIYTMGRRQLDIEENFQRPVYRLSNRRILKPLLTLPPFTVIATSSKFCTRARSVNNPTGLPQANEPLTELNAIRIISIPSGDLLNAHGKFFSYEIAETPTTKELEGADGWGISNRHPKTWASAALMMHNMGFPIDAVSWPRQDRSLGTGLNRFATGLNGGGRVADVDSEMSYDTIKVLESISATLPRLPTRGITAHSTSVDEFVWRLQSYFEQRYIHANKINLELYSKAVQQNFVGPVRLDDPFLWELARHNMFIPRAELNTLLNSHVVSESIFEIKTREDLIAHLRPPIRRNPDPIPQNSITVVNQTFAVADIYAKLTKLEGSILFTSFPQDPSNLETTEEYRRHTANGVITDAAKKEAVRKSKFFKLLDGPVAAGESAYHRQSYDEVATFIGSGCGSPAFSRPNELDNIRRPHAVPYFLRQMLNENRLDRTDATSVATSVPIESGYFHLHRPSDVIRRSTVATRTCTNLQKRISPSVDGRLTNLVGRDYGSIPFSGTDRDILNLIRASNHPYSRALKFEIFRNWSTSRRWSPMFRGHNNRFWCAMAVRQPLQRIGVLDFQGSLGDAWRYIFSPNPDVNGIYNSPLVETNLQRLVSDSGLTAIRAESFFAPNYLGRTNQRTGRNSRSRTYQYQYPTVFADGKLIDLLPDMSLHVYVGGPFGHVEYKLRLGGNELYIADYKEELPRGLRTEDGTLVESSSVVLASYNYDAPTDSYPEFIDVALGSRERNRFFSVDGGMLGVKVKGT